MDPLLQGLHYLLQLGARRLQRAEQDSKLFSMMSYMVGRVGVLMPWQLPMTPDTDDIAAAQRFCGANMKTRTGDTTYGFNSNADEPYFHITNANQSFVRFTAWDAGGNDTFDFSGYDYNHVIDRREPHLSSVSHLSSALGNVEGYNVGNGGADFIGGGASQDAFDGGDDNDLLQGGQGDDQV